MTTCCERLSNFVGHWILWWEIRVLWQTYLMVHGVG